MSSAGQLLAAGLVAGLVSLLSTPLLRRYLLANGVVDLPGERRSHHQVTPRGGGLAMASGLVLGFALLMPGWLEWAGISLLVLSLSVLGWLDDRFDLAVRWRLPAQVLIAVVMVVLAGGVSVVEMLGRSLDLPWLWSLLAVPAVVWLINLHNFMDGSDGLAAAQGIWTGSGFALLFMASGETLWGGLAWLLVAVCAGFLAWNRPPAVIFMGDTGSLLLGGVTGWLALVGAANGAVPVWISLVLCSVFALDATATLLRRLMRREQWYTPHRQHAYQRLIIAGWSHGQVLVLHGIVNLLVVSSAVLVGLLWPQWDLWLTLGVVSLLTLGWLHIQSAFNGEPENA